MRDKSCDERRPVEYYNPGGLGRSLVRAAGEHGYKGLGVVWYAVRRWFDYRLSGIAYGTPYNGLRIFCHRLRGVNIGQRVLIGYRCVSDESFPALITIEDDDSLAGNVYVLTHSKPYAHFKGKLKSYAAPVVVKQGAWVTINVTVLPGVTIGERSVITAGSVVTKAIPPDTIACGNPAKVIKRLSAGAVNDQARASSVASDSDE